MTHQLLLAPAFIALGWLAGLGHFSLLALQVRAMARQGGNALAGSLRFALAPALLLVAATAGALALTAALAGFIMARALAVRHAGWIAP